MSKKTKSFILSAEKPVSDEVRDILQYAPRDFQDAFEAGTEAEWKVNDTAGDSWWANWDDDHEPDDPDGWSQVNYYANFSTSDGKLYRDIMECDHDGNHDHVTSSEVGSESEKQDLREFSYGAWNQNIARYYDWVAEHGDDPLGWFINRPEKVQDRWLFGFVNDNGVPKFWKARHLDRERETVEDWRRLPEVFQQFLNLDQNGHTIDVPTWQELVAVEGVEVKQARDGTEYAQIRHEDKVLAANAEARARRELIANARRAGREAKQAARKKSSWTMWGF